MTASWRKTAEPEIDLVYARPLLVGGAAPARRRQTLAFLSIVPCRARFLVLTIQSTILRRADPHPEAGARFSQRSADWNPGAVADGSDAAERSGRPSDAVSFPKTPLSGPEPNRSPRFRIPRPQAPPSPSRGGGPGSPRPSPCCARVSGASSPASFSEAVRADKSACARNNRERRLLSAGREKPGQGCRGGFSGEAGSDIPSHASGGARSTPARCLCSRPRA